ncbi:MAG: hypothetical protein RR744_10515 [Cellulosilyticaceae bacterium]
MGFETLIKGMCDSNFSKTVVYNGEERSVEKGGSEVNCYDYFLELLVILADIDRAIEKKAKTTNVDLDRRLDAEIDRLEIRMFEIKNIMKNKKM